MENQKLVSKDLEASNISKLSIKSNKDKSKIVDISTGITDLYYYESVLQETIKVSVIYGDTGNSVPADGKFQSVLEGLPLVGQENVEIKMIDGIGNNLKLDLYVNTISPILNDTRKNLVALDFVSKEYILSEQTRVNKRFDGKLSDHVDNILTDFLKTKKNRNIETTSNNYNFIGNNKKPLYVCTWLSKKSIPEIKNAQGNTAGYFFYETSKGFQFRSIDKLLEQKPVRNMIFNETPDTRGKTLPEGFDTKILSFEPVNNMNIKSKFEMGAYSTKMITFDPFNCVYNVFYPKAEETQKNLVLGGRELPTLNPEFPNQFTRTQYMLIDVGSLPSGNTKQQIEKSKQQNFDPINILNQATMRYNQLFTLKLSVTIPADFNLNAGDTIRISIPEQSSDKNKNISKQFSGIYMISDLCHYIKTTNPRQTLTKLNLVRDSYGKKNV